MISAASRFKLLNRGFKDTLLLIPGWGADHRIFDSLKLDFNYLAPAEISFPDFNERLIESMAREKIDKISILGWSLGAFLAADFISAYPERAGGTILFVSARRRYGKEELEIARVNTLKNREAYLYKFYNECFSKTEGEARRWFKSSLLQSYLSEITTDMLVEGLDYLSRAQMYEEKLERIPIKFVHGREDRIAPLAEALKLKEIMPCAEFSILDGAGHMPFLNSNFKDAVING